MRTRNHLLLLFVLCLGLLAACGASTNTTLDAGQTNTGAVADAAATPPPATATRPPATATPGATAAPTRQPTARPTGSAPQATATAAQRPVGSEILFLRGGNLLAYDIAASKERQVAEGVRAFAATPDGRLLALVRGAGRASELWLVRRDGSGLRRLTTNQRAEDTPVFAPDGTALAFAAAPGDVEAGQTWGDWSRWCAQSQVVLLDLGSNQELKLGAGCDPAISPDGRRVAFATAPSGVESSSSPENPLGVGNAIRLVNRQGQNGWNFATAGDPAKPESGRLVFAPAWSPDGQQLAYQRFVGYQTLVDILYTEVGKSFEGKGQRVATGAGWLLAPRFAPKGGLLAISDNNDSDARGWGGYEQWSVEVIRLGGQRSVAMPEGPTDLASSGVDGLPRAQWAAWSPDGAALAVQLPPGWQPNLASNEPLFTEEKPGEIWRWTPGQQPAVRLVANVDFASPLLWLPALR